MSDDYNLDPQLVAQRRKQLADFHAMEAVDEAKRLVKEQYTPPFGPGQNQTGEPKSKGSNINHPTTGFLGGIIQGDTVTLQHKFRIRFSAFCLEDDPEGIRVLTKNGTEAFRYDARYPGVSLVLDVLSHGLKNNLCPFHVPKVAEASRKPELLILDISDETIPAG